MTDQPLDGWLSSLPAADAVPDLAVHPRVLTLSAYPDAGSTKADSTPGFLQLFVVWRDPGGARALHDALRACVEGALLMELCRVGETRTTEPLSGLRLVVFEPVAGIDAAVAAFGLTRAPLDDDARRCIALARGEASALGRAVPDACWAVYAAPARATATALAFERTLAPTTAQAPFGAEPGALFAALETVRRAEGHDDLPPDGALDVIERELVVDAEAVIRWIPPACFAALCDAVAVIAARRGAQIAWAESEADADGIAPPPLIRVTTDDGHAHVPLGVELLRWCVMPRRPGEVVPPLSAWLAGWS